MIGDLRTKENTRRLERPISQASTPIVNMTLSGSLYVSVNYVVRTPSPSTVARCGVRAGVDLGLRSLATVSGTDGNIIEFLNPASLRDTLSERHKVVR